jgi:predicted nucleic acid-binding protein
MSSVRVMLLPRQRIAATFLHSNSSLVTAERRRQYDIISLHGVLNLEEAVTTS